MANLIRNVERTFVPSNFEPMCQTCYLDSPLDTKSYRHIRERSLLTYNQTYNNKIVDTAIVNLFLYQGDYETSSNDCNLKNEILFKIQEIH